jgi:hypothetical protein
MNSSLKPGLPRPFAMAALALSLGLLGCAQVSTAPESRPPGGTVGFGSFGGGLSGPQGMNPYNMLANLDESVSLTADQKAKALDIFKKEADDLNAFTPAERPFKGMEIRQAATANVRALLTPEQQQRLDANRRANQAQAAAERAVATDYIRSSKGIAARLGTVTSLSLVTSTEESMDEFRKGRYTYNVMGSDKSETLKVYWEKPSLAAPMKVVKVEGSDGVTIKP